MDWHFFGTFFLTFSTFFYIYIYYIYIILYFVNILYGLSSVNDNTISNEILKCDPYKQTKNIYQRLILEEQRCPQNKSAQIPHDVRTIKVECIHGISCLYSCCLHGFK